MSGRCFYCGTSCVMGAVLCSDCFINHSVGACESVKCWACDFIATRLMQVR